MTTEAESSNQILAKVSTIHQTSSLKFDVYYDTVIRGCAKKCPCRTWVQCHHYIDITKQQMRLKYKSSKTSEEIHEWYDNNFRLKYEYNDVFGNG